MCEFSVNLNNYEICFVDFAVSRNSPIEYGKILCGFHFSRQKHHDKVMREYIYEGRKSKPTFLSKAKKSHHDQKNKQ